MLATTRRLCRLLYANVQRVIQQRWVGSEADGEAEFKVASAFVSQIVAPIDGRVEELGKEV